MVYIITVIFTIILAGKLIYIYIYGHIRCIYPVLATCTFICGNIGKGLLHTHIHIHTLTAAAAAS